MAQPYRPLPPIFAKMLQAKIDELPENIRETVREHMRDLLELRKPDAAQKLERGRPKPR